MPLAQTRLECLQVLKLLQCIRERDWVQVEKLVVNGVPDLVNYTDPTLGEMPLSVAAANDDLEMVERLLRLGASPDAVDGKGRTAVMRAAERGNYGCVDLFVKTKTANLRIQDAEGRGQFISLSVHMFVHKSVHMSVHIFVHISVHMSVHMIFHMSAPFSFLSGPHLSSLILSFFS